MRLSVLVLAVLRPGGEAYRAPLVVAVAQRRRNAAAHHSGRSVSNPRDTIRLIDSAIVHPVNRGPPPRSPKGPFEFLSGITFPGSGRWVLVGTSGVNWGCFVFDVQ